MREKNIQRKVTVFNLLQEDIFIVWEEYFKFYNNAWNGSLPILKGGGGGAGGKGIIRELYSILLSLFSGMYLRDTLKQIQYVIVV